MANLRMSLARNNGSSSVVTPEVGSGGAPGTTVNNVPQIHTGQVNTLTYNGITLQLPGYTPTPGSE